MAEFAEPGEEELDFGQGQEAHYKEHKKELLGKLRLEAESLKNNRDHIVGELAKLDYNHQREALHDLNDHYPSLSEFHLSSKISKKLVPDEIMGVPLKSRHTRNREVKEEKLKELKKVEKEIKDIHRMIAGLEGKERRSQWWVCGYPAGVSDKDIEDFKKNFELCGVDTTETREDPSLPKQFSSGVAPYSEHQVAEIGDGVVGSPVVHEEAYS